MATIGKKHTDEAGYIYIIENPAWPGYCKVGRTNNPERRLLAYQTGSPRRDYVLVHHRFFTNADKAEDELHAALWGHRAKWHGEWFHIHAADAVAKLNALARQVRDRERDGAG